jgi:uncharacterized membrane-anchored protein
MSREKSKKIANLKKENEKFCEQLDAENSQYYRNVAIYIRSSKLLYDNVDIENSLLEILEDILSAQKDGKTAEEYFGKNPAGTADQIIANFDKPTTSAKWKSFGKMTLIVLIWTLFYQLTLSNHQMNAMPFILSVITLALTIPIYTWLIHNLVYKNKIIRNLIFTIGLILAAFILVFYQGIQPASLNINLSNNSLTIANGIFLLIGIIGVIIPNYARGTFRIILPYISVITIVNMIRFQNYDLSQNKIFLTVTSLLVLVVLLGTLYALIKSIRKHPL